MIFLLARIIPRQVLRLPRKSITYKLNINFGSNRSLSTVPQIDKTSQSIFETVKEEEWIPIYHFPMIQVARLFNRLKLYQSAITFTLLPTSIGMYNYNLIDLKTISIVSASAIFTCMTLFAATSFFKRLVGVVFVSQDEKFVKISHLTFWGRRKDIAVPADEVIPLTEGSGNANDAFVKLYRTSTDEVLYITLRFGAFLDRKRFQDVFGNFELLGFKK